MRLFFALQHTSYTYCILSLQHLLRHVDTEYEFFSSVDANRDAHSSPVRNRFEEDDFDSLLKQAQSGIRR